MSLYYYKINNNNCSYVHNKKNIVLLIRRSPGELDWILPLLYNIRKQYNIFTIFRSSNALSLIKKNKIIYKLWRQTSFAYTIEPKFKSIFWRINYHLFKKTFLKNILKNKFQKKYYDTELIQNLLSKKKFNINTVAIFAEFVNFSPWINKYKIENKNLKIIHFPHTTNIFGSKKIKYKNKINFEKKNLFLSNSYDIPFWKTKFQNTNIIETGYLKYDKLWLKNIISKKIKNKKKIIFLSLAGYDKGFDFDKYKQQIKDVMDVCTNIPKFEILISAHPLTNKLELKKILNLYNKKKWKLVDGYHLSLVYLSDICISGLSSASILDALVMNKTPIELWNIRKKKVFESKFKRLKLTLSVKNKNDLQEKINSLINKKMYRKERLDIKRIFNKNFNVDGSIVKTKKIFNKILENKSIRRFNG